MSHLDLTTASRPFDPEITAIADYVFHHPIESELAYTTAYYDLLDSLACALLALQYPDCVKLLGPVVPHATLATGARIPGTAWQLEPVHAAFNWGALIRWLDFNDTWLAAEWGHPSDNLGGILTVADYVSQQRRIQQQAPITVKQLLTALIKAHEIQGVYALENSFNRIGLDHVILVKVATTAVVTQLLNGNYAQLCNAVSNAWIDGHSLRTYRHAPNTGSRKSWAAGDATSRGVRLALLALQGEMGYPTALSAKDWGFYAVYRDNQPFSFPQPFNSYVMENILFKIAFPAEFHAQTAVECAFTLHELVKHRLADIKTIHIHTHEAAMRIINKQGPLHNPADRDHCLQYMVAIGLTKGTLTAEDYEPHVASNPLIDELRSKMAVSENADFSRDYLDPHKRSIANAIQIEWQDGSRTAEICVEYPLGHRRRRQEGIPWLMKKFEQSVKSHYPSEQADGIIELFSDRAQLESLGVDELVNYLTLPQLKHNG